MHISYKMKLLSSRRKRDVFSHINFIYRISRRIPTAHRPRAPASYEFLILPAAKGKETPEPPSEGERRTRRQPPNPAGRTSRSSGRSHLFCQLGPHRRLLRPAPPRPTARPGPQLGRPGPQLGLPARPTGNRCARRRRAG